MKNIKNYGTFSLDEANSYYYSGNEKWKEKFNSEYQDLYDEMISSAEYRNGGTPSPEDLLVIFSAFELILETPEEISAVYELLKSENPKFALGEESMRDLNSPAVKAAYLYKPHMMKIRSNPAYKMSNGAIDHDKLFPQGKLDLKTRY
jgi:hypothetical protein